MANELICVYPTGCTLYAHLFDATGQIWNGSSFEAPASGNWADYDIAMTEAATATQIYRATMPAASAGAYSFVVRKQAGGSPAVADIAVAVGQIQWNGTAESTLDEIRDDTNELQTDWTNAGRLDTILDAILADTNELQTGWADGGRLDLLLDAVGTGAGAVAFTYTLTSSVDSTPIVDADVWVTSDAAGTSIIASGSTDANGQVVFYLDTGTVYIWRQKPGWNFTNPDTETVA
jgi:hypothetical protein